MRRAWLVELRVVGGLLAASLALGYLAGGSLWWIAGAGLTYVALNLHRAARYLQWLREEGEAPPPEGSGLWAEVVHDLHQRLRNTRETAREAAALVEQYERSAQALPDGIAILDADQHIRWSNPAAQRLIGLQDPEDRGQPIDNLLRYPEFTEYRRRGELDRFIEVPSPTVPGNVIMVGLVPFPAGGFLLVCRDVTERVRVDRVRRDFLSNVSHELRTPITVLGGYLEMLQEAMEELPARWHRPVNAMHDQAARMRLLVEDLLLLSRMESLDRPDSTEEIDVDFLVAQIREEAEVLSGDRGHRIELAVESGTRVSGSRSEIRAVFSNLVRNAIQYTPDGSLVRIEWWLDEEAARFVVTDEGEGIESEHLSRLTERFYRVDKGRSREAGGTGLGLAIVKHALNHYDAELEIESEPGRGSRFACRFPRDMVARAPTAGGGEPVGGPKPRPEPAGAHEPGG